MRIFWALLCWLVTTFPSSAQSGGHVVLISIDGLRPAMYLDSCWPSPNLQHLMKTGVYAVGMTSVFPSFTYPAHASMVTGAYPATHGVFYNAPMGGDGRWNWRTDVIKAPTLWDAAKRQGIPTAAVQWPISVGAPVTYNVPEIWNIDHPSDRITTSRQYATGGLVEEIEQMATGRLDSVNMNEERLSLDENAGRMAAYIFRKYHPGLLAVHFACVDGAQHEEGPEGEGVRLALASADRAVGDLIEAVHASGLSDSTTFLVLGDHGFSAIKYVVRPNQWLFQNGFSDTTKNWKARFQPAGGSAFLYLQHSGDTALIGKVVNMLAKLPDSVRATFRVVPKSELSSLGADPAAYLALAAKPGFIFSSPSLGSQLQGISGGHHGYDPSLPEMKTGFIASGRGIAKGRILTSIRVVDIAPLVARLLTIPFNPPDGQAPGQLFPK